MEPLSAAYMMFGIVLLAASWVLLLIVSFREDYNWGLCTVFVPPLSYLYSFFSGEKAKESVGLAVLGCILLFLGLS